MKNQYVVDFFKEEDQEGWLGLWQAYVSRGDSPKINPEIAVLNWEAVLKQDGRLYAYALRDTSAEIQGFAHYVEYFSTKSGIKEAYLMDLYVDKNHRGQGGGRMLMEHLIEVCKRKNISRLSWITVPEVIYNERFYESYAPKRLWDRYVIDLSIP
jgi:GNAT superfamily N-acetyltransferase